MAENGNFITIIDEDNNEIDCEILDTMAHMGKEYAVLLPIDDQSEESEAVILEQVREGESGEELLRGIDDEATLNAVFTAFLRKHGDKNRSN